MFRLAAMASGAEGLFPAPLDILCASGAVKASHVCYNVAIMKLQGYNAQY